MENKVTRFRGIMKGKYAEINWFTRANNETEYFELQRSLDGITFETVAKVNAVPSADGEMEYIHADDVSAVRTRQVFYRLKSRMGSAGAVYTGVLKLNLTSDETDVQLFPNPVNDMLQLSIPSVKRQEVQLNVYDMMGTPVKMLKTPVREGVNMVQVETSDWKPGAYIAIIKVGQQTLVRKFVIQHSIAF
jgi:hypothetical protein